MERIDVMSARMRMQPPVAFFFRLQSARVSEHTCISVACQSQQAHTWSNMHLEHAHTFVQLVSIVAHHWLFRL